MRRSGRPAFLSPMPRTLRLVWQLGLVAQVSFGWSLIAPAAERSSSYYAALESITADDVARHVAYLADDAREGREAGTPGGRAAAAYIAEQFAGWQLQGAGVDGGFFQPFPPNFRNVLALLPGSDPALRRQVVLVAAHYDHVGRGTPRNSRGPVGYIHNGADDNASGTAAVLELAEAFAMLSEAPKRSILFLAFDAEEKGLFGSKHWVAHPTLPLKNVILLLDMDMVGRLRDEQLRVFGSRSGYGLRRLLSRQNEATQLRLAFSWNLVATADHYPFFAREIPVLMLHTGLHDEYHSPRDKAHLINTAGESRVARFWFSVAYEVADRAEVSAFRMAARQETETLRKGWDHYVGRPPDHPLRLGITWRTDDAEPGTVILTCVVPGSPAAEAGLRIGDRIYQIGGHDFADDAQFAELAQVLPEPLELLVERDGRLQSVVLHFKAEPLKRAA